MLRLLPIILLSLLSLNLSATCVDDLRVFVEIKKVELTQAETTLLKSFWSESELDRYGRDLKLSSSILNIPLEELSQKIKRQKFSLEELFEMVNERAIKLKSNKSFLEKSKDFMKEVQHNSDLFSSDVRSIMNNKALSYTEKVGELFKQVADGTKETTHRFHRNLFSERMILNPDVLLTTGTSVAWDAGSMLIPHYMLHRFARLGDLAANIFAFSGLEIYINLKSSKSIVSVLAEAKIMQEAGVNLSDIVKSFSKEERAIGKSLKEQVLSLLTDVGQDFKVATLVSSVPNLVSASMMSTDPVEILVRTLVDSAAIGVFFSTWTKFRYHLLYQHIFPFVSERIFKKAPAMSKIAQTTLVGGNIFLASFTWVWYYNHVTKLRAAILGKPVDESEQSGH